MTEEAPRALFQAIGRVVEEALLRHEARHAGFEDGYMDGVVNMAEAVMRQLVAEHERRHHSEGGGNAHS